MKIIIVGGGALGSIVAGHLCRSGESVTLVARGSRAEYLKQYGITITGLVEFTTPCRIMTDLSELSTADCLIVAVKTYDTETALTSLRHLHIAAALSIQNGVLKDEHLATVFGKDKTLGAAAFLSGEVMPEGSVRFTLNQRLFIGELPEGTSARVYQIVKALDKAGIRAEASSQIRTVEWTKFVGWIGWTPLSLLTRLETYKFLSDADISLICVRLIREAASLAEKFDITLEDKISGYVKTIARVSETEAVAKLRMVGAMMGARAPQHRMSALQDLERGRPLELEETLGYVLKKATEEELAVPTIETMYRLLSGLNRYSCQSGYSCRKSL